MAELSAETQAIVERLQAEGKLLRNTGSNSIRSVKVELSKFEGIFNTISNNITSQTETMRASMGAQADIAEREREQAARQRAFDDLEQDSESAELKALRDKVETQKLKNDLASEKDKAKGDGLFKKLSGLGGLKILGGGLLAVGALAIGYGYLNSKTDGGLDRMVLAIKDTGWKKISESMNLIAEKTPLILTQLENALKPENLEALAKAAGAAAVAGLGIGALAKLGPSLIEAATAGYLVNEVRKARAGTPGTVAPGGDGPDKDKKMKFQRPGLKSFTVAGLATYALSALMPKIGDYIRGNIMGMTPTEIANKKYDAIDFGGTVLKYATIGSMFGVKGALVGAGIGAAIGIGEKIVDVIRDDLYDEGAITNRMEDALEEVERIKTDAEDKLIAMTKKREELSKNLTEAQLENIGLGNDAIQAQRDIVDAEKAAIQKAATEAAQTSARQIQTEIDELTEKEFRAKRVSPNPRGRDESDEAYMRAKAKFDKERLDEILRLQGQQNQTIQTAIEAGADPEAIQRTLSSIETPPAERKRVADQMARDLGLTRSVNDIISSVTGASTANQTPIMMQTVNNVVGPTTTYNGGSNSQTTVSVPFLGPVGGSGTGLGG